MSSEPFIKRKILLVRHGRTDWNDIQRFQGSTDIPLNRVGLAQAEAASRRIAEWSVDVVYASPLSRALQTAELIGAPHAKHPIAMDDLTEINFGSWEGLHFRKLLQEKDESLLKWMADPLFSTPDGGEDWSSIKRRAERVVGTVLDSPHRHVVIVSHGGMLKALMAVLLGFDPHTVWKIKVSNCSFTGIEVMEHETELSFANDCMHLAEMRGAASLPLW